MVTCNAYGMYDAHLNGNSPSASIPLENDRRYGTAEGNLAAAAAKLFEGALFGQSLGHHGSRRREFGF